MSLINDALKRAGQAHTNAPATIPVGSLLQPVQVPPKSSSGWPVTTLVLLLGGVLTLAVMLAWQMTHRRPSMVVRAPGVATAEQAASVGMPVTGLPSTGDGSTVLQPAQPMINSPQTQANPVERLIPGAAPTPVHARTTIDAGASQGGAEPVPVEIKPELKLQGLVYRPGNASALVSGKTVYVGDRVLNARVTRITRNGVTLNRDGEEIVLLLD